MISAKDNSPVIKSFHYSMDRPGLMHSIDQIHIDYNMYSE